MVYRSMLFVPGHKASWPDKGIAAGADALILDLEDSVPGSSKGEARQTVGESIDRLKADARADLWVRPNALGSEDFSLDLEAVVRPGLSGLLLPKVSSGAELARIDAVVSHLEQREGLAQGSIHLIVTFETAKGIASCEEIAVASPRTATLLAGTGPDADVGRELGFEFSVGGLETLYLRSRILLAARASGMAHPITGVWQDVHDLSGLEEFAEGSRRLGFRGMVCIHPSHVGVVNGVFTPSFDEVDYYRRMMAEFDRQQISGQGSLNFEGRHIDAAHIKTAHSVIALYERFQES